MAISCNKNELDIVSETHPVTLSIGLAGGTKVSHDYSDNKVKPAWEDTDYVFIQFEENGTEYLEKFDIDASTISEDGKSANFSNPESQLTGDTFKVIYSTPALTQVSGTSLTFDLAGQKGDLEELPEYLEAVVTDGATSVALESKLTYFHFVLTLNHLDQYDHIGNLHFGAWDGSSFESGYFRLTNTNESSVESVDLGTPSITLGQTIDLFVAVFQIKQADNYNVKITMEKAHGHSAHEFHYSWNPKDGKEYVAGKVYKVTGELVKK